MPKLVGPTGAGALEELTLGPGPRLMERPSEAVGQEVAHAGGGRARSTGGVEAEASPSSA